MSSYDYDYDKYYEYLEAKRESEEMDEWVAQRDAERERVLATLTKEERAMLDDLNEKQINAFKVMASKQDSVSMDAYDKARATYQKAAEKWPALMDGYD
jgi:predicted Fe-S protein YdhL (DUF1289 family)